MTTQSTPLTIGRRRLLIGLAALGSTSLVLAKAVEKVGSVDLVVCGMASTDGAMSVVPAMLAERLDLPQVTLASVIETQGDQVRIKRDGDVATEVIGASMPLVLSVTVTPRVNVPDCVGVPLKRSVAGSKVMPVGRVPVSVVV